MLHTTVVFLALDMTVMQLRLTVLVHRSHQGSPYGQLAFDQRRRTIGVRPSMGLRGDAYDNAMVENCFSALE